MTPSQLPEPPSGAGQRPPEPAGTQPSRPEPAPTEPSPMAGLAADYAAKAGLHRTHDGRIDVLKTAGGVQGIAESIVPGLLFLVATATDLEIGVTYWVAGNSVMCSSFERSPNRRSSRRRSS